MYYILYYNILYTYIYIYISSTHQSRYTVSKTSLEKSSIFVILREIQDFGLLSSYHNYLEGRFQSCIPMNIHSNHSLRQSKGALLCKAQLLPVGIFNPSVDLSRNDLSQSFQKNHQLQKFCFQIWGSVTIIQDVFPNSNSTQIFQQKSMNLGNKKTQIFSPNLWILYTLED